MISCQVFSKNYLKYITVLLKYNSATITDCQHEKLGSSYYRSYISGSPNIPFSITSSKLEAVMNIFLMATV